ncbi:hypothetical protein [Eubacterium sp.]|jgi:hypothetical protein|uniref:hypothetical protein n=1 Tax=Eubacterium sp. TaxID=142586 RepID=UPI0025BA58ED|nr:hypothetical protein [Eubacterium sp.]
MKEFQYWYVSYGRIFIIDFLFESIILKLFLCKNKGLSLKKSILVNSQKLVTKLVKKKLREEISKKSDKRNQLKIVNELVKVKKY